MALATRDDNISALKDHVFNGLRLRSPDISIPPEASGDPQELKDGIVHILQQMDGFFNMVSADRYLSQELLDVVPSQGFGASYVQSGMCHIAWIRNYIDRYRFRFESLSIPSTPCCARKLNINPSLFDVQGRSEKTNSRCRSLVTASNDWMTKLVDIIRHLEEALAGPEQAPPAVARSNGAALAREALSKQKSGTLATFEANVLWVASNIYEAGVSGVTQPQPVLY
jgi:hypothetical protein